MFSYTKLAIKLQITLLNVLNFTTLGGDIAISLNDFSYSIYIAKHFLKS